MVTEALSGTELNQKACLQHNMTCKEEIDSYLFKGVESLGGDYNKLSIGYNLCDQFYSWEYFFDCATLLYSF